jgi:transposase
MGAPYSQDLRLRVLASLDSGMSKMQAHKTFGISRSTIDDWLQLREQSGSVQANTAYRRGAAPAIADLAAFEAFIQRHQHSTLGQMATAWHQETGQKLSTMPFSTALKSLGYTRKKRAISTASVANKRVRSSDSS